MSLLSICTVCTCGEKRLAERRKKALAKLASKLKKLLANFQFHSHLASWRVVISTPAGMQGLLMWDDREGYKSTFFHFFFFLIVWPTSYILLLHVHLQSCLLTFRGTQGTSQGRQFITSFCPFLLPLLLILEHFVVRSFPVVTMTFLDFRNKRRQ
jgi:hypothetical protein